MDPKKYVDRLAADLQSGANPSLAIPMMAYMRNKFDFLGIPSPTRKEILRKFIRENSLPDIQILDKVLKLLWGQSPREYQYCAMSIAEKQLKFLENKFLSTLEFMITKKSWWDTVDYLAASVAGGYFKKFTEFVPVVPDKWAGSDNMWLNRSAILFQLKFRENTSVELLEKYILSHIQSNEFFIQKAIGWSLRQYSKSNPEWVVDFIDKHPLAPLSKKEGLKWLNR